MLNPNFTKCYVDSRGFTLIELVVSMGLFLFILSISMGSLLNVVQASRTAGNLRIAMDNLNLAVEDMSRNIRQGYHYHCGESGSLNVIAECPYPNGQSYFAFEPFNGSTADNGDQVVYRLNNSRIEKSKQSGTLGTWYSVTSPNIEIDSLQFYYEGTGGANQTHPLVNIVLHGTVGSTTSYQSEFTVQTSIAQRSLGN